jgi:hyperosmotically inducible protein
MRKLLLLVVIGAAALAAYNYSNGRELLTLPGISAGALKDSVRDRVGDTVRDGMRTAARQTSAEVKERAAAGVHAAVNRTEEAVAAAALTSKIKAKMALDDVVKAADVDVDTDGSVVTLSGTVGSRAEQQRAVRIASETAGVSRVVDRLALR